MREDLRRGEFEARDRQLPADLDQTSAFNSNARARESFQETPVGTPPVCYDVRSVFDSRPINTYDFNITQGGGFTPDNLPVEMTVPEGYVAILRGVEIWFEPNPLGAARSSTSAVLQLNGGDYPNNGFLVGVGTNGPLPVFLLADEFNRIGVKFEFFGGPFTGTAFVAFSGNFVLKTARAYPFEVANPVQSAACSNTVAPPTPTVSRGAPASGAIPVPPPKPTVQTPGFTDAAVAPIVVPRAIVKPPFAISWTALRQGTIATRRGPSKVVPMQNDRGQRRLLSTQELRLYDDYLQSIWPAQ